jgi:hypothetical protein
MSDATFGSTFNGGQGIHELTGEPYLAVTIHSSIIGWRHRKGVMQKILWKKHVDARGRTSYRARKWPNMPFTLLTRARYALRPQLCAVGFHHRADITEVDGSVWRAGCLSCDTLVRPHKKLPANPSRVAELQALNAKADKMSAAIDAYLAGEGPCPHCAYPDGKHEPGCWEAE